MTSRLMRIIRQQLSSMVHIERIKSTDIGQRAKRPFKVVRNTTAVTGPWTDPADEACTTSAQSKLSFSPENSHLRPVACPSRWPCSSLCLSARTGSLNRWIVPLNTALPHFW